MKQQNNQTHIFDSYNETKWHYLRGGMLVPAPPEVDARQMSGFIAKHDQTSIWKTIRSKTTLYLRNRAPIVCIALFGENQLKKELGAPAPGQRDHRWWLHWMQEHEYRIQKSKLKRKPRGMPLPLTFPREQPMVRR